MKLKLNLYFEALSAVRTHKLDDFTFYAYTGPKKHLGDAGDYNQRHPLVLHKGDVIGLKKTTRGHGAGNFQLVNASVSVSALFRNVPHQTIAMLNKYFDEHTGQVKEMEDGKGGRVKKTKTHARVANKKSREVAELFRGDSSKKEVSTYEKENYQWRVITSNSPIGLKTAKQGRVRDHVKKGDIVGVRYIQPARGGWVVVERNGLRLNVSKDAYMDIVENSDILPADEQRNGLGEIEKASTGGPRAPRTPKPKTPVKPTERKSVNSPKTTVNSDYDDDEFDFLDDEYEEDED